MGDILSQINEQRLIRLWAVREWREDKLRQMGALALSGVPQRLLQPWSLFLWLFSQIDASEIHCQGLLNSSDIIMIWPCSKSMKSNFSVDSHICDFWHEIFLQTTLKYFRERGRHDTRILNRAGTKRISQHKATQVSILLTIFKG